MQTINSNQNKAIANRNYWMELDGIKTLLELSTCEEFLIIRTRGIVLKTDG